MEPQKKSKVLIDYLRSVKESPATMAELRCLLNAHLRPRGWKAIARVGGIGDVVLETVAGLYARHPQESDRPFARACRKLADKRKTGGDNDASQKSPLDVRFRRLLSCPRQADVCALLYPFISGMKAEGIGVNYESLCQDLIYWGDRVKEAWAKQYWETGKEEEHVLK